MSRVTAHNGPQHGEFFVSSLLCLFATILRGTDNARLRELKLNDYRSFHIASKDSASCNICMYDAFDPSRLTLATSARSISPLPCLLLGSWSLHVLRCTLTDLHSITSYQTQEQPISQRLAHNPDSPRTFGRSKPAWTLFTTHNTRSSCPTNRTGEMLPR
jgi:hypothetical protein